MVYIFDGKKFAKDKERELAKRVKKLKKRGITPTLETVLDGNNPASVLYVSLKKQAGERVGASVNVYPIADRKREKKDFIKSLIRSLNRDKNVHGIMVQLPLSPGAREYTEEILNTISPEKDVDGLRDDSKFTPATVKAVIEILDFAKKQLGMEKENKDITVCVAGVKGFVGSSLLKHLQALGYDVVGADKVSYRKTRKLKWSEVLISATGTPGFINESVVKEGAIVVDVGSPKGDVSFTEVAKKASFITPVPGGVGPVTVSCLLENLVEAAA
ncbi:bifunctional 5,10-methylenetetrahydrofolate dehydrogenase/5,10-methenyltetrahydrofolate cyclohydrolase [Candidatus Woesebacteria bacterium]|nr:bifunctional 5,10-methylenetetrahydrofolate dehydrogenase/5,10-methenyltetrahydrofolate cyclohydrolase [Candidatus Woesebacteria bacterium]